VGAVGAVYCQDTALVLQDCRAFLQMLDIYVGAGDAAGLLEYVTYVASKGKSASFQEQVSYVVYTVAI
jgi:hypothetical protein